MMTLNSQFQCHQTYFVGFVNTLATVTMSPTSPGGVHISNTGPNVYSNVTSGARVFGAGNWPMRNNYT